MTKLVLEGVSKEFKGKDSAAVHDLDLEVEDGEFLVVVGPSGCGKSTTLRMIAGFETPTSGLIRFGGKVMNTVPPKDRNIAMVFQNYALFPHMTVAKNLSFGLHVRREPKSTIKIQIETIADLLGIYALLARKPAELSGGERQRVALGRALLRRPDIFLLDEPLSNLDAALRVQMRMEIKRIHEQFPVTMVYVTHDQVEAMTMADRIALMRGGRLQQVAAPERIYDHPANSFVASFIGTPKINLFPGSIVSDGGSARVSFLGNTYSLDDAYQGRVEQLSGSAVTVGFRPESIRLVSEGGGRLPTTKCTVELVEPLGSETHVLVRSGEHVIICKVPARSRLMIGDTVNVEFEPTQMKLFDPESDRYLDVQSSYSAPTVSVAHA
jgi:multiple sugar transport system ATP-binding protein